MLLKSGVKHKSYTTVKGHLESGTQHGGVGTEVVDEHLVAAMVTAKGRVDLSLE